MSERCDRYVHRSPNRRFCCAGERKRPVYQRHCEMGKAPTLVQVGESDLQDYIQSFADECDVTRIVQRYANGDTSVLQRLQGVYTDVAGVPTDLTTAFETVAAARAYYETLPEAARREFGSLGKFLDSIVTLPSDEDKPNNTNKEDNPV